MALISLIFGLFEISNYLQRKFNFNIYKIQLMEI
jgi:hypothetical protein